MPAEVAGIFSQINPRSAKDMTLVSATMKWSSTRMSTSAKAFLSSLVSSSSARDGSGCPEGWLCARMTALAFSLRPALTTSLGYTDV